MGKNKNIWHNILLQTSSGRPPSLVCIAAFVLVIADVVSGQKSGNLWQITLNKNFAKMSPQGLTIFYFVFPTGRGWGLHCAKHLSPVNP